MSFPRSKNKQNFILTAVFIFTLAASFVFLKTEKADAAGYCNYYQNDDSAGSGMDKTDNITETECTQLCNKNSDGTCPAGEICTCPSGYTCSGCKYFSEEDEAAEDRKTNADQSGSTQQMDLPNSNICNGVDLFSPATWFNCLMLIILQFLAMLLEAVSFLFSKIVDPKVFSTVIGTNPVVYNTWAMVRDTLNIAFILTLLFSAFCTVFQVEKFGYKKILLTLVIMALLVNFSFPISRVIIDFSNVIMYYFINNLGIGTKASSIFPTIAENSAIANIIAAGNAGTDASSSMLMASVVFMFILVVTVFIITILLLIRIVALAFLVIFSSVAFVGSIVPFLSSHASKWWDNLFKYSFFGPIMLFMIYVSIEMMGSIRSIGPSNEDTISSMAFFSLPIVILLAGLMVAKNMSIMGATAITGSATKFLTWSGKTLTGYRAAKWGAKAGITAGAKKLDRDVLQKAYLSPRTWSRAWKKHTEEKEEEKMGHGESKARDVLEKVFNRGRKGKNYYQDKKEAEMVAKYKKEQEAVSTQDTYCLKQIKSLQGKKDIESRLRTEAYLMTMSDQKDLNEFMKLQNLDCDPESLKKELIKTLSNVGMDEEDIAKTLFHIGNNSFAQGDYAKGGMAGMDRNGNWKINDASEQKGWVLGKVKNVDKQKLMINMRPGSIITERGELIEGEDEDHNNRGEAIAVHDIGKEILEYLESVGAEHMNRIRGDLQTKLRSEKISPEMKKYPQVYSKLIDTLKKATEQPAQPAPAQNNSQTTQAKPENKIEEAPDGHTYNARPGSKMTF